MFTKRYAELYGRFALRKPDDETGADEATGVQEGAQEGVAAEGAAEGAEAVETENTATPGESPEQAAARAQDARDQRIRQLVAERHQTARERDAAEARARLAEETVLQFQRLAQGEEGALQGGAAVQRNVDPVALAQSMALDQRFNDRCNAEAVRGRSLYADFDRAISALQSLSGGNVPRDVLEAALETGKGSEVLYELSRDPDAADRVLRAGTVARVMEITRIADKVTKGPAVSRAPAPARAAVGTRSTNAVKTSSTPGLTTEEWMRIREKEAEQEQKRA